MPARPRSIKPPADGVWRIGRGDDPLAPPSRSTLDLGDTKAGNRFDSITGQYGVLYFATTLEGCFGETLNRYRVDPRLSFIAAEWEALHFMKPGSVPRDWRMRRTAVRVTIDEPELLFLDVEDAGTLSFLKRELGGTLLAIGYDDLDIGLVRGHDRRVTRFISEWAWRQGIEENDVAPVFAGIRYLSRMNSAWECWAVFDDSDLTEVERQPILLSTPGLREVAELYGLQVF